MSNFSFFELDSCDFLELSDDDESENQARGTTWRILLQWPTFLWTNDDDVDFGEVSVQKNCH